MEWKCPFCGQEAELEQDRGLIDVEAKLNPYEDKKGTKLIAKLMRITCPNPRCNEFTLALDLYQEVFGNKGPLVTSYQLRPKGLFKQFPQYVPETLREDYQEACLILEDSPKAFGYLGAQVYPRNHTRLLQNQQETVN
jgi:hypothetical protein